MQTYTITYWLHFLEGLLPWVVFVLFSVLATLFLIITALNLLDFRRLLKRRAVLLELTPPAQADKTPEATHHLFSVLHGLMESRSLRDKVLRRKVMFSLEVVSTREQGIRYMVRTDESEAANFEQAIVAYLPDVKLLRVDDYLSEPVDYRRGHVIEAKQTGHFAYPLRTQISLDQNDPMAYLTGAMTHLLPGELMAMQLVISPTKVREAGLIAKRLLYNEEVLYQLGNRRLQNLPNIFKAINSVLFSVADGVGDTFYDSSSQGYESRHPQDKHEQQVAQKLKPARMLSAFEQELAQSVHDKLNQPLFRVSIRAIIISDSQRNEQQRVKGIRNWLSSFNVPKYQSLRVRYNFPLRLIGQYRKLAFKRRLPGLFTQSASLFSASELADLYHFPHSQTAKTENVIKSLSKTLPAPISLKGKTDFDIVLGRSHHHGAITDIGLTALERERHVYIIGGTGNGKTTMMLHAMVQDLKSGKGFAFVDPHGDAAETILRHTPEDRINDVIYFNPDDLAHPIGLNLLELAPGLTGDELLREKDLVTEHTISVFRKIFSDDGTGGHRIEYVLRNTIQTALTMEGATLFTIFKLLNDDDYRKNIVATLKDQDLKNFWKNELGKAGDFQRVKMSAGITAKVGRFLFSASAKRILEQPKSTIDFDDIINSGKVLICNFSKGLLGEDTSELFGITVLAKLQMAALRRARVEQSRRQPFYLYVDEFQNFATASFVQMLSEARKYKLFLLMAEQSTSQQDEQQLVNIILANVGTVVCFRSGNPADEQFMLPLFSPYVEPGEIANLPSYNFYARLSAVKSQEPMSGETIVLKDDGSNEVADRVKEISRTNNAIIYQEAVGTNSPKGSPKTRTGQSVAKGSIRAIPKIKRSKRGA